MTICDPRIPRCRHPMGALGTAGDVTVSSAEIDALDRNIRQANADIMTPGSPAVDPSGSQASFLAHWVDFFARWKLWDSQNSGGTFPIPGIINTNRATEFQAFETEFREELRQFAAIGGKTGAQVPDSPTTMLVKGVLTLGAIGVGGWLVLRYVVPMVVKGA